MSDRELSNRQLRAINYLLSLPTAKMAAEKTGVTEKTMHLWLNQPAFVAKLRELRQRVIESTLSALQASSGEAVAVLHAIMCDTNAGASVRVAAAKEILGLMLRSNEQLNLELRLQTLEARLAAVGQPR